jgi:hypothetical protein
MIFNSASPAIRTGYVLAGLVACQFMHSSLVLADEWQTIGHLKYFFSATDYPSDNIFAQAGEDSPTDQTLNLRLTAERQWPSKWDIVIHYEAGAFFSDTVAAMRSIGVTPAFAGYSLPNDDARLFDLTSVAKNEGKEVIYHRLDRASVGYTERNYVVRFGRQAVSWGNGLVFQPMDIFNPFSPTAIDKEYKTGDDMLYLQYLLESGDDAQAVLIPRRDINTNDLEQKESSLAIKYHAIRGTTDMDFLVARHFSDNLAGFGFATDWEGAVVRGDVVNVWNPGGPTWSGVVSVNYSWVWHGYNVTGLLEFYRNGYGIDNEDYNPAALAANPELLSRMFRGELFTLGQDYLTGGLTVELTPRWLFNPLLINNVNDGSWLTQWLATFDWKQNLTLLIGANIPFGGNNTEFGGIPTDIPNVYTGEGNSIYLQLAYYF